MDRASQCDGNYGRGLSVGVDMISVSEVSDAIREFGDLYVNRVFTSHEIDCSTGDELATARHFAACFAAKEATIKVLGADGEVPGWGSIEVKREAGGRTSLRLTGLAAELAERARLKTFAVSMTHRGDLAAAVVIAR
ncbi:MAG: holo-ACP synthase [Acidimicrobiales bacterium]